MRRGEFRFGSEVFPFHRRSVVWLLLIVLGLVPVFGEEGDIQTSTHLELQVTTSPAAKLLFNQNFIFPFLRGSGPLTKGNNLTTALTAEVTPVSVNGIAELRWIPAAFFILSGGGSAGSGWNMALGNGIGINKPADVNAAIPREAIVDGSAFDGLLWKAWGAGTLQFDLGAVIPGDWTHVLMQTRQELRYGAYTRAGPEDSWFFENDSGENQNGWVYYASYVLGYQMPLSPVLNTIAFMAEFEKSLYKMVDGGLYSGVYWGEDLGKWVFSTLFNFSISPRFNTTLAIQMRTRRNHGLSNFDNSDYFYKDFELQNDGGNRRLLFYRVALLLNYRIR